MQDEDKRMLEMAMEAARPKWTGDSFSQCQRLVDHTGKIIGEVRRNLAATEWVTPNGDRYISPAAARKAVERAAAIGEGCHDQRRHPAHGAALAAAQEASPECQTCCGRK